MMLRDDMIDDTFIYFKAFSTLTTYRFIYFGSHQPHPTLSAEYVLL